MVSFGLLFALYTIFIYLAIPIFERRANRVRTNLKTISQAVKLYKKEQSVLPDSVEQLDEFARESRAPGLAVLPAKNPRKRGYLYLKLTNEKAAVVYLGKNGRLDTPLEVIVSPSEDRVYEIEKNRIQEVFGDKDDYIYVVDP